MIHIKELQYQVDQKLIEENEWNEQKELFNKRVEEQKACIWEKIKAKFAAEFQLKSLRIKLRNALQREPLNEEFMPNMVQILPNQKDEVNELEDESALVTDEDFEESAAMISPKLPSANSFRQIPKRLKTFNGNEIRAIFDDLQSKTKDVGVQCELLGGKLKNQDKISNGALSVPRVAGKKPPQILNKNQIKLAPETRKQSNSSGPGLRRG